MDNSILAVELKEHLDEWEKRTIERQVMLNGLIRTSEEMLDNLKHGIIKDEAYIDRMKKVFDFYTAEKEYIGNVGKL